MEKCPSIKLYRHHRRQLLARRFHAFGPARRRVSSHRPPGEREREQAEGEARQRVDPEVVRSRPSSAQGPRLHALAHALAAACAQQEEEPVYIDPTPITIEPVYTGKYK